MIVEFQEETIPAYGMEEFFSDVEESRGETQVPVLEGNVISRVSQRQTNKRAKNRILVWDTLEKADPKPQPRPPHPKPPFPPPPPKPPIPDNRELKYKYVSIRKRLMCLNEKEGRYSIGFPVDKNRKGIGLEFFGIGEQGNYKLEVLEFKVHGKFAGRREENWIKIDRVPAGTLLTVEFRIDFDRKCMMEVNYYEAY